MISRRIFVRNALIVSAGTWAAAYGLIGLGGLLRRWLFPRRLPAPVLTWLEELDIGAAAGAALDLRPDERGRLVEETEIFLARTEGAGAPLAEALRARIHEDFSMYDSI